MTASASLRARQWSAPFWITTFTASFGSQHAWFADRRGRRVMLARNLLVTLRSWDVARAAKDVAAETGLEHRPVAEGQRVVGI
jgi:hypothetical protein